MLLAVEVRVALAKGNCDFEITGLSCLDYDRERINDLLIKADEAGYWQRPHEVRHVLEESQMSHKTMARIAAKSIAAAGGK